MLKKTTEPYIATYLHSKGIKLGLPIGGNFELTARCNFDCPMCYVHLKKEDIAARGKELTSEQWIDIARRAKEQGMVFVLLTGGEPFVRSDFFEIYGAMKEMGFIVSINSNGSLISGEIRRKLIENPPMRINISLYGGCSETYQNMCGVSAFDTVIENIRELKAAGIDVSINLSITDYNRHDIEKIYGIAKELGINIKASSYMYPSIRVNGGKFGKGNRLSPKDAALCGICWDKVRLNEEDFFNRAENIKNLVAVDEPECSADLSEGVSCRAGRSAFWMTWDGKMLPCGMMPGPTEYPLEVGFDKAWENIKRKTAEIRLPAKCLSCKKRSICPVCAAVCVTETGHFDFVPEYVCEQMDETILEMERICREKEIKNGD